MSMKNLKRLSIVCTIGIITALLFNAPSFAGLGKIAGTVTDEATGEALAGAQVQIVGTTMGAAANTQGQYFILNVRVIPKMILKNLSLYAGFLMYLYQNQFYIQKDNSLLHFP